MNNVFFDPDVHEPIMRRALIDLLGADRFLYGDNVGGSDGFHGDLLADIGLTEAECEQIRSGNALRIMPAPGGRASRPDPGCVRWVSGDGARRAGGGSGRLASSGS
jgi:hypothetical protein